jgi:hypothetical protein
MAWTTSTCFNNGLPRHQMGWGRLLLYYSYKLRAEDLDKVDWIVIRVTLSGILARGTNA